MHAFEIPGQRVSLPAGGAVPRRRFVKVNSDSAGIVATAGGAAVGVSMNEAAVGEVLEIALDGIVVVEASAGITAGVEVSAAADGKAVTATAQTQNGVSPFEVTPGSIILGIAITTATLAGQFLAVKLL